MTYQDIHGWFTWEGLYKRMVERFPSGATFVEIGTYLGKSACYMGQQIKESGKAIDFFCIDPWDRDVSGISVKNRGGSWFPDFWKHVRLLGLEGHIIPFPMENKYTLKHFRIVPVQFVFIDAEHDYASVLQDIALWSPLVSPGGVIAGHDYTTNEETKKAVDDYFRHCGKTVINEGECWLVEV